MGKITTQIRTQYIKTCVFYAAAKTIIRLGVGHTHTSFCLAHIRFLSFYSCILVTGKGVLLQTVKTLMKCRMMRHFIRVFTVC